MLRLITITVRALSSRSPANLEWRRWSTYTSHSTSHGVSHQITGRKTAPCRPGATIARLSKRCMQIRPRTRRNLDCCRIGRYYQQFYRLPDAGSKTVAKSEIAVMLGWLIEKGSVRFGNQ